MKTASALDEIHRVVVNRHEVAKEWKAKTGRKVLGYFCGLNPEELFYAAGLLPVRILGGHTPITSAEEYIVATWCPLCRDCFQQVLDGKYDYVSGIVNTYSCFHIQQSYDSWQRYFPLEYNAFLFFPGSMSRSSPSNVRTLVSDYENTRKELENWLGKKIPDSAVAEAIQVYDTNRALMREIWSLRKASPPKVSGTEALEIALAGLFMDKKEHSQLLRKLLTEFKKRDNHIEPGVRLMLLGSEFDDVAFVELAESLGGNLVTEEVCTTTRWFWADTPPGDSPFSRIATRLLYEKLPCPQKDVLQPRVRPQFIADLAKEYNVQGAIIMLQKFCDPHQWDVPPLTKALKEVGVPILLLESDVTTPAGQFRTRLEAFYEMLAMGA